jgi:lipopolysaccharide transport system ATP-binding protein
MEPIIKVNKISKEYRLGQTQSYVSLRDNLASAVSRITTKKYFQNKSNFFALKNVSFNVYPGEVVGIIGSNGAGKSTLLKILSGITYPTSGQATIRGRVGSLLEVGTGFHQELTGQENIFLNGAILGMKRKEIDQKLQEIIEFSGIDQFLDTPVKHYSSGMRIRLAFAVAAHLDPEILLIDEVLAVGDAQFQKKCLNKMNQITKQSGRTILFVSHNMAAVSRLCKRSVLLKKGRVAMIDSSSKVIGEYLKDQHQLSNKAATVTFPIKKNQKAYIKRLTVKNYQNKATTALDMAHPFYIEAEIETETSDTHILLGITNDLYNKYLIQTYSGDGKKIGGLLPKGKHKIKIKIDPILNEGTYSFFFAIQKLSSNLCYIRKPIYFSLNNNSGLSYPSVVSRLNKSILTYPAHWEISSS